MLGITEYLEKRIDEIRLAKESGSPSFYSHEDTLISILEKYSMISEMVLDYDNTITVNVYDYKNERWDSDIEIPSFQIDHNTLHGRNNADSSGVYVHMINQKVDNFETFISNFLEITGEVCVSYIGDQQFSVFKTSRIGFMLQGIPTATFNYDCYSKILPDGRRQALRDDSDSKRSESWIIPNASNLIGIVYSGDMEEIAIKIAESLNIAIYTFDMINSFNDHISLNDILIEYTDNRDKKLSILNSAPSYSILSNTKFPNSERTIKEKLDYIENHYQYFLVDEYYNNLQDQLMTT